MWAALIEHEPPGVTRDRGDADVCADNHVAEEQPLANKRLAAVSGWNPHNRVVRRVEAQSCSRQTVRDKVNPQELDRNQSFRHSQQDRKENAVGDISQLDTTKIKS